jgi:hypothetical protein
MMIWRNVHGKDLFETVWFKQVTLWIELLDIGSNGELKHKML